MCHTSFPSPTCSKLARLARAQKRSNNNNKQINSARKAQRVDCDTSDSGDALDCSIVTVRDNINCDVNTIEVNIISDVSTDNVNCDVSGVQDDDSSTNHNNISNTDLTSNTDCQIRICQL